VIDPDLRRCDRKRLVRDIARRTGASENAVYNAAHHARRRHEIKLTQRRWTAQETEYMRQNVGKVKVCLIARALNRTPKAVLVKISKLGLRGINNRVKRTTEEAPARAL